MLSHDSQISIIFLSIYDSGYSRSWTYYSGLTKVRSKIFFHRLESRHLLHSLIQIRNTYSKKSIFVISSPSQYVTLFARLLLGKRIYLDAGWSLFEGTVLSRKNFGFLGFSVIKNYLIDFISSHAAKRVFVESELQKRFYSRLFLIRKSKLFVTYTGVDEDAFTPLLDFNSPPAQYRNIVLFRGKYNPEAGIEVLSEATHLLESKEISFWVYCPGLPPHINFGKNAYVDTDFHSKSEIATLLTRATLSLGQLSNHPRLSRTIPHKAYESAFLSCAYLSARTQGILELFRENEDIFCFKAGDSQDLALKIEEICCDLENTIASGAVMNSRYLEKYSQMVLASQFIKALEIAID